MSRSRVTQPSREDGEPARGDLRARCPSCGQAVHVDGEERLTRAWLAPHEEPITDEQGRSRWRPCRAGADRREVLVRYEGGGRFRVTVP